MCFREKVDDPTQQAFRVTTSEAGEEYQQVEAKRRKEKRQPHSEDGAIQRGEESLRKTSQSPNPAPKPASTSSQLRPVDKAALRKKYSKKRDDNPPTAANFDCSPS
ncbi:hypothetical protein B0A52_06376 [Exophiala mesophila]|uniref:Uncharacterized protein n=1 Tax=Exophiala mesophila TaxID=212818 RepID=A0A438N218_EXOME|nr:hypothetical protein B0A52_06376 [Exophiala mesophila]